MSTRRPTLSPAQLKRMLDVLLNIGFTAKRVEISPEGAMSLYADGAPAEVVAPDPLAAWEAKHGLSH